MANLTIAAASVKYVSGPVEKGAAAGEAFAAGSAVYRGTDGKWRKGQSDGTTTEAGALGVGLALFTADAVDALGTVALDGAIVQIGTGTAGVLYVYSATAGLLAPVADMVSTNKVAPVCIGIGGSPAAVQIQSNYNAGAVVP